MSDAMSDQARPARLGFGGVGRPSPLLKAESLTPLAEAESAAQAARAQAQRIIAEAQGRARQIEAAAEEEGRKRAAALLGERAARSAADLQEMSRHLPELVTSALRLLLEPAPPAELIARAAKRALQDFGSGARLTLNVPAPLVEEVRERLTRLDPHHALEVRGDPQAPPGSSLLQTPWGDVELGLAAQIQALEAGLRAALEAPEPPQAAGRPNVGPDPFEAAQHAPSAPPGPQPQQAQAQQAQPQPPSPGGMTFSLSSSYSANYPGEGELS
ncbi:HrpE/YscL family type III secretion apparatus protein [Neomegalonema perideroedes]|uniref:HrpE/YscL family type III secretion apparatus protein n=1 Tax=Neomegalonema perideroedes TaxID=217219 RepID=UPI000371579B|nr:HrpE/YscL family type III secretion apparatus protein [Neomegalonema perideroedes]